MVSISDSSLHISSRVVRIFFVWIFLLGNLLGCFYYDALLGFFMVRTFSCWELPMRTVWMLLLGCLLGVMFLIDQNLLQNTYFNIYS